MQAENLAARLNRLSLERCVPLSAQLELTRRCPLRCRHCYLPAGGGGGVRELTTLQWRSVLRQLSRLGTLSVVFTGGEPLLRPDLPELCSYATELGFEIRIFTSGHGLTPALAARLTKSNIAGFELSFYGRRAVHDAVTGSPGSWKTTVQAASLIKRYGFGVKFKTPLMRSTESELYYIESKCRALGYNWALDPVLTLDEAGSRGNLRLRLPARRLAALLAGPSLYGKKPDLGCLPVKDSPPCGAGRNVIFIGAGGEVRPCLQLAVSLGNVRSAPLKGLWQNSPWLKNWRRAKAGANRYCLDCGLLNWCSRCPGVSLQETGSIDKPYPAACLAAKAAKKTLTKVKSSGS